MGAGFVGKAQHRTHHPNGEFVGETTTELHRKRPAGIGRIINDHGTLGCRAIEPGVDHFGGETLDHSEAPIKGLADEMAAVQIPAAAMLDARKFKLGISQYAGGHALGNGVEALFIHVTSGDVVVSSHPIRIVQGVIEDRIVVAQDPVVRIGIALELRRVKQARVEKRDTGVIVTHIARLTNGHEGKLAPGAVGWGPIGQTESSFQHTLKWAASHPGLPPSADSAGRGRRGGRIVFTGSTPGR